MTDIRPQWMKALQRLIGNTPSIPRGNSSHPMFGTVKQLNPLRITLDNDPVTWLNYAPPCLDYPTFVGQRVWVETYGRQVVIIGVSKGAPDLPVGTGALWTGAAAPPSPWMLAEGQLLPRVDYPELSAAYGSTYTGSTASMVALPDARGRTPFHIEAGSTRFGTLGQIGGAKDVTLTEAQIPSHKHAPPDGYFYVESPLGAMRRSSPIVNAGTDGEYGTWRQRLAESGGPLPTASTGGGESHENLPPYLVQRFMVKTR